MNGHKHRWVVKKLVGIFFRYCSECGRLERKFPRWHEYPRRQINPLLGVEVESLGYHRIVHFFDPNHQVPSVEDMPTCWVCGRETENLTVRWSEWPEEFVNVCWSCYRKLPSEVVDFHEELRRLRAEIRGGER
jgi:hypothetical protein